MLSSFHCLLGLHVYDSRKCVHCTLFISITYSFWGYLTVYHHSFYTISLYPKSSTLISVLSILLLLHYHHSTFIYPSKSLSNRL
nr:MAG TPA: hypothetical protein [Bacteriophage sp.]